MGQVAVTRVAGPTRSLIIACDLDDDTNISPGL